MFVKKCNAVRWGVVLLALVLAGCGSKSASTGATPIGVGVGIGVALTTPTGVSVVEQGTTLEIDAAVSNDPKNAGVTWALVGPGSISSSTTTKLIYQAPTGIVGATVATVVATSISDTTQSSAATITINGTPSIAQPIIFPANVSIAYATYVSVAGGVAPYTWAVSNGTLPAGLQLDGSTTQTIGILGTPTAVGSSTITLTVTDANSATASTTFTIVVNPKTACILNGTYAYSFSGFRSGVKVVRAGSFTVDSSGNVTGIFDSEDGKKPQVGATLTKGLCKNYGQNRGYLQWTTPAGGENWDYATNSTLSAGQLQQNDGTGVIGGGQFVLQDATAFPLSARSGDFVLGASGDDGTGRRYALVGRFTQDATGAWSSGSVDDDAATPLAGATLASTLSAVDANGRGTATLNVGSRSLPIAYYVVSASRAIFVSASATATDPRLVGEIHAQVGGATQSNAALSGPAILSLWGSTPTTTQPVQPASTVALARLSNANPTLGTLDVVLDVVDQTTKNVNSTVTGAPYAVAANGRGTLTLSSSAGTRAFVLYADGAGGGFVLEPSSSANNYGILEPQVGAPYTSFNAAYFVGGTVNAVATSPITLASQILFQLGSISGNITGTYALDPTTGRLLGQVTRNLFGGTGLVMYLVSPGPISHVVVMGDGVNSTYSQIAWLEQF
jgi:hypothetical protein